MTTRPALSAVVPVFNEEEVIERALSAIASELERTGKTFEIVVVDDGSTDSSLARLRNAVVCDPRIRPLALSRNFGKEAALAAGMAEAGGDAVIFMDADLQHPPGLIHEMVDLWEAGHDVVDAVKTERAAESPAYRLLARLFNAAMGGATGSSFHGASDFKLLDRQVVDALCTCPERGRFFRGLVAWVGFRRAVVPFTVADRAAGRTKWTAWGLARYSLRNLVVFSAFPLKVVAAAGFVTLLLAGLLATHTLWRWSMGTAVSGFTTVILLQLILGGLLLTGLGVTALYVAQIYDETKGRPVYIVRKDQREAREKPRRVDSGHS